MELKFRFSISQAPHPPDEALFGPRPLQIRKIVKVRYSSYCSAALIYVRIFYDCVRSNGSNLQLTSSFFLDILTISISANLQVALNVSSEKNGPKFQDY